MLLIIFALAAVSLFNLALGSVVFSRNTRSTTNAAFFVLCLSYVFWGVAIAALFATTNVWFAKATFVTGVGIGYFLVVFTANFPSEIRFYFWVKLITSALSFFFAAAAPTNFIIIQYKPEQIIGPLFGPYMLYLGALFVWGLINLVVQFKRFRQDPLKRRQIILVFSGFVITLFLTFLTNLVLPFIQGEALYVQYGPVFPLFFILFTTIAILRYRLLNIKILATEFLIVFLVIFALAQVFLSDSYSDVFMRLIVLFGTGSIGALLIRSVVKEVRRREELQRLSSALKVANKKLRELDALKTEFLSIASHQLRTPLAVMKGYVASLQSGLFGRLNGKQNTALTTVGTSTEQLIILVNHLLDLTRIESGRLAVRLGTVDVGKTVGWVVDFMRPQADSKGIKLLYRAPPAASRAKTDEEKLKEVVVNLVDNALKYTEKGSVTVAVRTSGNQVTVEVKDTGYGLTTNDLRHVFEKFARGSASKHVKTTSGLGLFVCRKLVDAMGGQITATSQGFGRGSTFRVTLPKAR